MASNVKIHEMTMTDGVMKMRPLSNGLEIKPGETIELKPNSFHAMFVGLKEPPSKAATSRRRLLSKKRAP